MRDLAASSYVCVLSRLWGLANVSAHIKLAVTLGRRCVTRRGIAQELCLGSAAVTLAPAVGRRGRDYASVAILRNQECPIAASSIVIDMNIPNWCGVAYRGVNR